MHIVSLLYKYLITTNQYNTYFIRFVDEAVKFPGLETFQTPCYATKQLISRAIEVEKMRKRMCPAEFNNVAEKTDQFDENDKKASTPKNNKGQKNICFILFLTDVFSA